jgi:hypothetical protein
MKSGVSDNCLEGEEDGSSYWMTLGKGEEATT